MGVFKMNNSINRRRFLTTSVGLPIFAAGDFLISKNNMLAKNTSLPRMQDRVVVSNKKIEEARNVAKKILKPTSLQLEHGLELHYNSLVIEPYGFSPRSAIDGQKLSDIIEAGASELEIEDITEEMTMTRCVSNPQERQEYMDAWEAAGVTCIFQNAGEEGNDIPRLLKRLARFTYVTDMLKNFVTKAATPDDIIEAKKQKRHCLYMSGNGVPTPQNWISVEDELRFVRIFFQLGIRMMHLTYNRRNMIGDGCAEPSNGGLSDFGRAVVAEMNRIGVIVDIAHSGWQTSLEAALVSDRPIVASHTVCNSVHEHIRAKPDNVIRAICDGDGFIGICCIPRFLGGSGDIAAMMKHIDYAVKKFGVDHVAIATDVVYSSRQSDREWEKLPSRRKIRDRWEYFWPPDNFVEKSEMRQSMAWTNWPLFTVGLVQMGYSDQDIQKIIGGNALRVARAVFSGA
jgi:membrane dipeptidase